MKLVAAILIVLSPACAAAQVNRCLDASGKVVGYAAECPAGTRAEETTIKSAPGASTSTQKSLAEREADFRKRRMEKQEADTKAEKKTLEAADRKRACEESRSYLKALQEHQRISRTDPRTGEHVLLSDSDYPQELARAERSVAQSCK